MIANATVIGQQSLNKHKYPWIAHSGVICDDRVTITKTETKITS